MSSYYIFDDPSQDAKTSDFKITKNLDMKKYQIVNLKTYPENFADAASKKYVDDEDAKLLDLAGNRAMTGDLDMGDNSIVAIRDINANNSVVSKKYVDDYSYSRNYIDVNYLMRARTIDMGNQRIINLGNPQSANNAATKNYVDSIPKVYNYLLPFEAHSANSWVYPFISHHQPNPWMFCKGLTGKSYFHLLLHSFNTDNSFPSNMTWKYKHEFFDTSGNLHTQEIFSANINSSAYRVPAENVIVLNTKFYFKDVTSGVYTNFTVCRLASKRTFTKTFGNESKLQCAIAI